MDRSVTLKPPDQKKSPSRADRSGSGRTGRTILLCTAAIVVLLLVSALLYGVVGYQKIYPNVFTEEGTALGGLTQPEAVKALGGEVDVFEGQSIALSVGEHQAVFTAQEVGATLLEDATAAKAYEQGRTGSFFSRLAFVATCLFTRHTVNPEEEFYIDQNAVYDKVKELAGQVDVPAIPYTWEMAQDRIEVKAAQIGRQIDQSALTSLIVAQFAACDFSPLSYEPIAVTPEAFPTDQIYDEIFVEPKPAYLDVSDKQNPQIMPHVVGVSFDKGLVEQRLGEGGDFIIRLVYTQPDITQQKLEASLFKDVLSTFTTSLSGSSSARVNNITLAAQFMNGTILLPGETFSYNESVGERTEARGFKGAGAYLNGRLVDEIGGGICQLSSTTYNTALLANLEIVKRQSHSMLVGYVPLGQDATVNWGTIDFQFKNVKNYPMQVVSFVKDGKVTVTLMGSKEDDHVVVMERDVLSSTPHGVKTTVNDAMAPGSSKVVEKGHNGASVQTYRVVKDGAGNQLSRKAEAKSVYRMSDELVVVGPSTTPTVAPTPDPTDTPEPSSPSPSVPDPTTEPDPTWDPAASPSPTPPTPPAEP